jgi:hypothetical protein
MNLMMFVTDDGSSDGTAPMLFLPRTEDAVLPGHPRSLEWKYVATISEDDNLALAHPDLMDSIDEVGFFVAHQLL